MNQNLSFFNTAKETIIFEEAFGLLLVRECAKIAYGADVFPSDGKELVKARLLVDLIESYGYSPEAIEVGKLVRIDRFHEKYREVDVAVYTPKRDLFMLIAVVSLAQYEEKFGEEVVGLFDLAATEDTKGTLAFLVYYTNWHDEGNLSKRYLTINYRKFKSFVAWHRASRPNEGYIPKSYFLL